MKVIVKNFASEKKEADFMKDCHEIAKTVLGDAYDKDVTETTAKGIWRDHADQSYDAKVSLFRNGLKR